jgi:hypothetical protein
MLAMLRTDYRYIVGLRHMKTVCSQHLCEGIMEALSEVAIGQLRPEQILRVN